MGREGAEACGSPAISAQTHLGPRAGPGPEGRHPAVWVCSTARAGRGGRGLRARRKRNPRQLNQAWQPTSASSSVWTPPLPPTSFSLTNKNVLGVLGCWGGGNMRGAGVCIALVSQEEHPLAGSIYFCSKVIDVFCAKYFFFENRPKEGCFYINWNFTKV